MLKDYLVTFLTVILVILLLATNSKKSSEYNPVKADFYVWQHQWNKKLEVNVLKSDRKFSILIAEFNGKKQFKEIFIPQDILSKKNITWVIRVSVDYIKNMPLKKILSLVQKYRMKKIQLDVDVPESKLCLYYCFLLNFKKRLGKNIEFSITALPCHLKHFEFRKISKIVDYYVLQVHGINFPKSINEKCALMKESVVTRAINKALSLGNPFKVALPTYAYILCFDKVSGKFRKLAAENGNEIILRKNYDLKVIEPDVKLIQHLFKNYGKSVKFIWFRLPDEKDKFNFDLKSIEKIEQCENFVKKIALSLKRVGNNQIDLYIKNKGIISIDTINLDLKWHGFNNGEFDLFCRTLNRSKNRAYAVLPTKLDSEIPPCGKKRKIASFYVETKKMLTVTIGQ